MNQKQNQTRSVYQRIYALVSQVPFGHVATYGQIAGFVEGATARMVGYAMAALHRDSGVPWQRIINHKGEISKRKGGMGAIIQRRLLEYEGLGFDRQGRIDLKRFLWEGPCVKISKVQSENFGPSAGE